MDKEALVSRMLAMNSRVEAQSLRTGKLTDDDWDRIIDAAEELSRVPLFIADNSSVTISELRSKCRKLKQRENIGLVILDYLQLMNASRPVESRQQFISEVSRSLKGLARELGVPVIALSQLNREVDKRTDHKPVLADLRESGAIEQDADVVIFISREDYYDPETERKGIATIDVAKQRNGSTGPIDLLWEGRYTQFLNMEHTKDNKR
jgi:replicative DNA helicase